MDEVRPDPVKTQGLSTDQPRVPSHKSLSRAKFVEPLTPLHRLARFKEIRDRNLARDRKLRKIIQNKRTSLAPNLIMDTVVHGVVRAETKLTMVKSLESLSGGNDTQLHTNGVEHSTNGDGLNANVLTLEQVEVIENGDQFPKTNGNSDVKDNLVESGDCNETVQVREVSEPEPVEIVNEKEAENESESEGGEGHESEGSSLDVVGESSSESLDLHVSRRNSEELSEKDPGFLQSSELASTLDSPQVDQPRVVTPELVRRIRAGGRIAVRRNLRGEVSTPALKRKLDDHVTSSSGKKARDDGTTSSPGWQFFSPSKSIAKIWAPFHSTYRSSESAQEADESMVVNVDDQSNIFDKINEETATFLIEESQEKTTPRWCAIM